MILKRSLLTLPVVAITMALFQVSPAQAGDQDFKLVNKTGYQIDEIYVSTVNQSKWGKDIMGTNALDDGESVNIVFTAPADQCKWDLKVKYNDGDEATWKSLDLCSISKVTLHYNKKTDTTKAETE